MLLTCEDCRGKISDRAHHCPHCGRPGHGAWRRDLVTVGAVLAIGLALVAWRMAAGGAG